MTTWAAYATLDDKARAEDLGAAIEDLLEPEAVGVIEVEDGSGTWEVAAYFTSSPDVAALALLAASRGAVRGFTVSELPETDWVSKVRRDLAPVAAGRFWVHGTHDSGSAPPGTIPLLIDAAMAFGTGHHGTTQGCLVALDRLLADGVAPRAIADVGAGTAVLAMAAAAVLRDATVIAGDNDPVAVEVASANLRANGLEGRVTCVEAAGFAHPALAAAAPYDLVLANILKGPLIDLAPDMAAHVAHGGHVILSGILNEQADDVAAVYSRNGFNPIVRDRIGDWTTLVLARI